MFGSKHQCRYCCGCGGGADDDAGADANVTIAVPREIPLFHLSVTAAYTNTTPVHRRFAFVSPSGWWCAVLVERGRANRAVQRRDGGVCLAYDGGEETARGVREGGVCR